MRSQDPTLNNGSPGQPSLQSALYERVFENSPDLISIVDKDYVYRTVNSAYLKRYGKTEEEIVGRHAAEILGRNVFENMIRPNLDRCFSGATVNYSHWVTFPKLGRRYMDVYYYPLPDGDGSPNHVAVIVRDITDRKSAEDALQESEGRFRLLTENIKDAIWTMDLNTRQFTYISPSIESLRGFTAEEVMAQRLDEALTPAAYEKVAEMLAKEFSPESIEQGNVQESYTLELEETCKDGSTISTEETVTVLFGADGKPKEILGVTRDITERKRMEEELRRSEEKYRDMFWEAPDIFFVLDLETMIITDANKYALEALEYGLEMMGKIHISDIIHPDDFERVAGRLRDMVINKDRMPNFPLRLLTRTGKVCHVEQSGVVFWDDDGNAKSFLGLAHDMTERKQAEEDLRLSEERYRRILDASHDMICVVDEDIKVLFANPAWHENMAYMIEGVDQLENFGMIHAEDRERVKEYFFQILAGKPARNIEYRYLRKGGGVQWIEGNANPINWPGAKRALIAVERDVTERKKAEEELRLTNERYQRILDASHDLIIVTDTKMDNIYFANEATRRDASYMLKEWNKVGILDTIHEDDRDKLMNGFQRTLAGESVRDLEYRAITKEGGIKWMSGNSVLIDWTQSEKAIVAIGREITERKQAEEDLKLSEERYRRILDTSHDMVVVVDENLDLLFANKAVVESTGYTHEDIEAQDDFVTIHPDDRERIAQTFLSVLNGEPAHGVEFRGIHKSGETRWVESNADMIYWDEGQRAVINVLRDVTERKQAEEDLKLSEERYRRILDSCRNGIVVMDKKASLMFANRAWQEDTGYTIDDFESKPFSSVTHPDDLEKVNKAFSRVLNGEFVQNFECRRVNKDGEIRWVESNANVIDWPEAEGAIVSVSVDITERKKAEEALEKSLSLLNATLDSTADGILVTDLKGNLISFNQRLLQMWRIPENLAASGDERRVLSYVRKQLAASENFLGMMEDTRRRAASEGFEILEFKDGRIFEQHSKPQKVGSDIVGQVLSFRDITERKRAEEALERSLSLLNATLESTADGILVTDLKGNITSFNQRFLQMWRIPKNLAASGDERRVLSYVRKQLADSEEFLGVLENTRRRADVEGFEILEFKDGRIFEQHSKPQKVGSDIVGQVLNFRDITERKRIEEALQKSEERHRAIFELAADSIALIDAETGAILEFNNKAHENLGYTREEFQKLGIPDFEVLESPREYKRHVEKVARDGADVFETKHRTKSGEIRDILVNSKFISIGSEKFHQSIWRDITDRNRMDRALRESEEKARALLDSCVNGILLINTDGTFLDLNETVAQRAGKSVEDLVGTNSYDMLPPDLARTRKAKADEAIRAGEAVRFTDEWKDEVFDVNILPVFDVSGKVEKLAVYANRITEQKRLEEELRRSQRQLRDLSRHLQSLREQDRTNIAREIHDELGQALTVLKMDTAWLARRFPEKEEALVEKTRAMTGLIDTTIQSVKRISTELRPSLLDDLGLGSAIEWQAEEFQKHTDIECEAIVTPKDMSLDGELSTAVFRIFQEALTNVARHAQATEITTRLEEIDGKIRLIVRDNGKGITASEISKAGAFGLVGIRERVNALRGEMKIVGIKGEGTALTVVIPIDD